MNHIPYTYKHLPIPGGGYVTGFAFHPEVPGILYARTDIGGVYRYLYQEKKWQSLIEHVMQEDLSESFPIAIALDKQRPERILIACGENKPNSGILAISEDYGENFRYEKIPTLVHGNLNGRGTGNRLIVDQKDSDTLYFASQEGGLFKTKDLGKTWERLEVCGEQYMTMIWQSPKHQTLVVGTAGVSTGKLDKETGRKVRGTSLYVSYNQGESFEPLMQPKSRDILVSRLSGYVAQRYDYDGQYLYITLSNTGEYSYVVENGYSCDSGDAIGGRVIRYSLNEEERIVGYEDITPVCSEDYISDLLVERDRTSKLSENDLLGEIEITSGLAEGLVLGHGFSGISSCRHMPGLLTCSTICRKAEGKDVDIIYLSYDYGESWQLALYDLEVGHLSFKTPYMKPQYNGGKSIVHWMSDVKINPFNPNELWFNSGTGVFRTESLLKEECKFQDQCEGIEETVHLNLYSVPKGEVKLIDILGDLGGFAFTDLDKPCENSFADSEGNRYITCINADYSDENPEYIVVTPRGNWTGKTKGGLIVSKNQCKTFTRLKMPYGLTQAIDERLREIERPNVNSGWVAVSANCKNIVWSIADRWIELPIHLVVYSQDGGESFKQSKIWDIQGDLVNKGCMKVFSDRKDSDLMYGFGEASQLYISQDGGANFKEYHVPEAFPEMNFGLIDCVNPVEVRGDSGKSGVFYMALGQHGLWKMIYIRQEDKVSFIKLSQSGEEVNHIGLGVLRKDGSYLGEDKALYISGMIEGEYGFYRSLDDGQSWERLNTNKQMFGDINSIEGDSRVFGRFFIATGSVGVLYGEPK